MLLSEAILLGSLLGPQLVFELQRSDNSSCAIGAALLATGHKSSDVNWDTPINPGTLFPSLLREIDTTVIGYNRSTKTFTGETIGTKIASWNNGGLSREYIAELIVRCGYDCEYVPLEAATEESPTVESALASR